MACLQHRILTKPPSISQARPTPSPAEKTSTNSRDFPSFPAVTTSRTWSWSRHFLGHRKESENEGVVIFLHVPKTGGTTIRELAQSRAFDLAGFRYERVSKKKEFKAMEQTIENILQRRHATTKEVTDRLVFYELHGDIPGLEELHQLIQGWKNISRTTSVPIFTFAVVREPYSFHISYFRFFHHPRCKDIWCEKPLLEETQEGLVQSLLPNHQLQCLLRGQFNVRKAHPSFRQEPVVEGRELKHAQDLLRTDWDWVGRLEDLSRVTLPLLSEVLLGDCTSLFTINGQRKGFSTLIWNKNPPLDTFAKHNLTRETRLALANHSILDERLYEWVRQTYKWDGGMRCLTVVP